MAERIFSTDLDVPETIRPELLLPTDWVEDSPAIPSSKGLVSPIEVSWILFAGQSDLSRWNATLTDLVQVLNNCNSGKKILNVHYGIFEGQFMHHTVRTIARIALDPRRTERFSLYWTFRRDPDVRFPSGEEEELFLEFYNDFGVVERNR